MISQSLTEKITWQQLGIILRYILLFGHNNYCEYLISL